MAATFKCSLGIALSLFLASVSTADEPLPRPDLQLSNPVGYGYGYGYWSGSTAHESILRGNATLIRSVGERHLLDAEAWRSNEEALSRHLDNSLKAQQTRYAMRRVGEAERNLQYAKTHARRLTQMAINDAYQISQNPSTANVETAGEARLRIARELLESSYPEHADATQDKTTNEVADTAANQAAHILDGLGS